MKKNEFVYGYHHFDAHDMGRQAGTLAKQVAHGLFVLSPWWKRPLGDLHAARRQQNRESFGWNDGVKSWSTRPTAAMNMLYLEGEG